MRTIIAGSRSCRNFSDVMHAVAASGIAITEVVSGHANGADKLGEQYAKTAQIPCKIFEADWNRFGRSAGPQRNLEMARYAEALIAVWDGQSPGTRHMIDCARRHNLTVFVYRTDLEHP